MDRKLRETIVAYFFLLPFLFFFFSFLFYPVIYSFYISLRRVTPYTSFYRIFADMKFVGFKNYIEILTDTEFWFSLLTTVYYAVLSIPLGMFVSFVLAALLNSKLKGYKLYRSAFFLPNVLDMLVVGIIWTLLYAPRYGIIHRIAELLTITLPEKGILGEPRTALLGIVVACTLKNCGFGMILFLAGMQNISQSVYEAAEIDGANEVKKHLYITLPLLRPIIFFMIVTGTIGVLNTFTEIYAMTGGGPIGELFGKVYKATQVTGYYLFRQWERMRYGHAAAVSYLILLITLILSFIYSKVLKWK